ncbi:dihydrouridine synthase [bacterium]|nr:dihydrouridine synthase [bacterium]
MKKKNFWSTLKKPIIILAPMANVTDAAFRELFAKYGKPDVIWTEFVSAEGLCSKGKKNLLVDLKYSEKERPIIAQIFGSSPETLARAAKMIQKLKFDGIDINMGCPDRSVERQGAGAALIKNPELAKEAIKKVKEAVEIPVSVKTRTGYSKDQTEEWIAELLEEEPVAITIHARTRKEMSKVPADWSTIKRAVKVRDKKKSKTLIIGNGDIASLKEAKERAQETGCDGIMIGRGAFGNPWFFKGKELQDIGVETRLKVMCWHTRIFERMFKRKKNFSIMKKHFKAYASDFKGAKELRMELMKTKSADEVEIEIKRFLGKNKFA